MEKIEAQKANKQNKYFKCKECAAKLVYQPGSEYQKCEYCGHENPIPQSESDIKELDFNKYLTDLSQQESSEERLTIKCQECAAQTTFDQNVTSQECAFCGTHIVSTAQSTKQIKPRSLLPFKIDRQQAQTLFRAWIHKLWFAPNDLKQKARQDQKINGVYVPYWTFDADTVSVYSGKRGEHYYVTERYSVVVDGKTESRTRQVQRTRWYHASGTIWENFNDVLVLASHSLPRKYTERLEPWDLSNLTPYNADYLSGFRCESYNLTLPQGFVCAKKIMDEEIHQLVRNDIGGDEQRIHHVQTQHDDVTFKHILLPIWISSYRYGKKVYRFLINARTGEVQGERPWSWIKITLATVIVLGAVFAVYLFLNAT
ncbi:MAG: hypothetical protein K8S27_00800 [Candidatus Omnitrophica bacterium]|nr:hypothetical protein [Candidatus Omnitrophota bacterium]